MTEARLNASVEVSALLRQVTANGDFGTILRKGDPDRGAILMIIESRGSYVACLQRTLEFSTGTYRWARVGPENGATPEDVRIFRDKQASFDADLWQIELDIASPERFIAETTTAG